jgi:hypothetical protein
MEKVEKFIKERLHETNSSRKMILYEGMRVNDTGKDEALYIFPIVIVLRLR